MWEYCTAGAFGQSKAQWGEDFKLSHVQQVDSKTASEWHYLEVMSYEKTAYLYIQQSLLTPVVNRWLILVYHINQCRTEDSSTIVTPLSDCQTQKHECLVVPQAPMRALSAPTSTTTTTYPSGEQMNSGSRPVPKEGKVATGWGTASSLSHCQTIWVSHVQTWEGPNDKGSSARADYKAPSISVDTLGWGSC